MTQEKQQFSADKPTISLSVSPRFEVFHGIRLALAPSSGADETWRVRARARLPESFYVRAQHFCDHPAIWPNIADAIEGAALDGTFFEILKAYAEIDPERFRYVVAEGILHTPEAVHDLIAGRTTLKQAVETFPEDRQAWLAFMGLFPFEADAPVPRFLARLVSDPEVIRDEVVRMLSEFWDYVFEDTWSSMFASMTTSLATLERTIPSCSITEIADRTLLSIEVNEADRYIAAATGNYRLPFDKIERLHFLPSAFNIDRLWAAFEDEDTGKTTVVFPYYDPSVVMTEPDGATRPASSPQFEPAMVFRALGNATRLAMIEKLACEPMTGTELARRMDLTKATVSHHVRLLRLAELLDEEREGSSATLSVRRQTIESLSTQTAAHLFGSDNKA